MLILLIELSRYCPGMVTALGVSVGLTASAIDSRGTPRQRERWVPDLLTLDRIGAWALTEPGAGSDAFGAMRAHARRDGDDYILNGSKTFITNGPYADTIVFICKLDEGNPIDERKIVSFVLDRGMPGLEQSPPLRKMGMHSSPTGEIFVTDLRAGADRLLGETEESPTDARDGAKGTFAIERAGVAAMALGIIERCLSLCVDYANDRVQFGRPIGEFQLIQDKLATMEIARLNVSNLVFRHIEAITANQPLTPRRGLGHEAVLGPRRDRGRPRSRAAVRRQRLHGRVRPRTARTRRQSPPDLRRHRRAADHPHRQRPAPLQTPEPLSATVPAPRRVPSGAPSHEAPGILLIQGPRPMKPSNLDNSSGTIAPCTMPMPGLRHVPTRSAVTQGTVASWPPWARRVQILSARLRG